MKLLINIMAFIAFAEVALGIGAAIGYIVCKKDIFGIGSLKIFQCRQK